MAGNHNHHNLLAPSLGGGYGAELRQRYSNSMLQRGRTAVAAPAPARSDTDEEEDREVDAGEVGYERWVDAMKTIEGLRAYIRLRLDRGDFSQPPAQGQGGLQDACRPQPQPLYPRIMLPQG